MPSEPDESGAERWWVSARGKTAGPVDTEKVAAAIGAGRLGPDTRACLAGQTEWRYLHEWPAFETLVPPPANGIDDRPAEARRDKPKRPWNPAAIVWLGVLFSPIWTGVMAQVNNARLGLPPTRGRPIWIAVVWVVVDIGVYLWLESTMVSLGLYGAALATIWGFDLSEQSDVYRAGDHQKRAASWGWPVVAGAPLALLVVFGYVVTPFLPLTPREVCERVLAAQTAEEAKPYTSSTLWPTLRRLEQSGDDVDEGEVEWLGEDWAPPDVGGYLVAMRYAGPDDAVPRRVEMVFHLLQIDGRWKVEQWYYSAVDDVVLEPWVPITQALENPAPTTKPQPEQSTTAPRQKSWHSEWWRWPHAYYVLYRAGWKGLLGLGAAIVIIGKMLSSFTEKKR